MKETIWIEKQQQNAKVKHGQYKLQQKFRGRCRDHMIVGFTTTYAISAYHH
jgi:hypothetical protein